nr:hypothetical protein [Schaalia turicensis]
MISLETGTIQLIGGDPDSIRICRVEGESLVTSVIPRDEFLETKQLPDIPPRGICYLLDEDHGNLNRVYAGQTTQGVTRLDAHKARKSIWNRAIIFLDDEANIERGVLDALEATSISFITSTAHMKRTTRTFLTPRQALTKRNLRSSKTISNSILPVPLPYSRWAEGKTAGQKG